MTNQEHAKFTAANATNGCFVAPYTWPPDLSSQALGRVAQLHLGPARAGDHAALDALRRLGLELRRREGSEP